jgi:hypothetical protein
MDLENMYSREAHVSNLTAIPRRNSWCDNRGLAMVSFNTRGILHLLFIPLEEF